MSRMLERYKALFNTTDTDNSGYLTIDELAAMMKSHGGYNKPNDKEIKVGTSISPSRSPFKQLSQSSI